MFYPGDKVICVNNTFVNFWLTLGKVYTVKSYNIKSYTVKLEEFPSETTYGVERFRPYDIPPLEDML